MRAVVPSKARPRAAARCLLGATLGVLLASGLWWIRSAQTPRGPATQERAGAIGRNEAALPDANDFALSRLSDEELELEHMRIAELMQVDYRSSREHSACLLEMARRGGRRWTTFLRRELDIARQLETARPSHVNPSGELAVLTALRRAEGRPDPARLVLRSTSQRTLRAGEKLVLEYALRNEDPDQTFEVSTWDFQRVRAAVRDASGAIVPRRPPPDVVAGGAAESWRLQPGASSTDSPGHGWWTFDLSEQFELSPGEYSLELAYAADRDEPIAFAADTRGLVVVRSGLVALVVESEK